MVVATGSILTAVIAAVAWGPNRLDVFRTGTVNRDLQHLWWDGSSVSLSSYAQRCSRTSLLSRTKDVCDAYISHSGAA